MDDPIDLDAASMANDSFLDAVNSNGKKVRLFKDAIGTLRETAEGSSSYPAANNTPYLVSRAALIHNIIYATILDQTGNAHRAEKYADEIVEKIRNAKL